MRYRTACPTCHVRYFWRALLFAGHGLGVDCCLLDSPGKGDDRSPLGVKVAGILWQLASPDECLWARMAGGGGGDGVGPTWVWPTYRPTSESFSAGHKFTPH